MDKYEILDESGHGAYGVVKRCRNIETGEIVAIKRQVLHRIEKEGIPYNVMREISILKSLRNSPNIVRILDVLLVPPKTLYIVMEFVNKDLGRLLKGRALDQEMSIIGIKSIMFKLLSGIVAIHKKGFIHRDLKPSNVLIDDITLDLKIADLGLARSLEGHPKNLTPQMVTLWYRAPELLLDFEKYSFAVDIWSAGCIFVELLGERAIFGARSEREVLDKIFDNLHIPRVTQQIINTKNSLHWLPEFEYEHLQRQFKRLDQHGFELLKGMLQLNPQLRISAKAALNHKYFDDVRKMQE